MVERDAGFPAVHAVVTGDAVIDENGANPALEEFDVGGAVC